VVYKKIAVFGGSFNPVHVGHIQLIDFVIEKLNQQAENQNTQIMLLPTFEAPHKDKKKFISFRHRFKMLHLAFSQHIKEKKVMLSLLEKQLPVPSYSYKTLNKINLLCKNNNMNIKGINVDVQISFIMGFDMFLSLPRWKNFEELSQKYRFIVLKREMSQEMKKQFIQQEKDVVKQLYHPPMILNNDLWDVSSTQIRNLVRDYSKEKNRVKKEKYYSQLQSMLPKNVLDYYIKISL